MLMAIIYLLVLWL